MPYITKLVAEQCCPADNKATSSIIMCMAVYPGIWIIMLDKVIHIYRKGRVDGT